MQRLAIALLSLATPAVLAAQTVPTAPRASGILAIGEMAVSLELRTAGDLGIVSATLPDGRTVPFRNIATVEDAVGILADQRLSFAWPALLGWAGADLVKLRARAIARAEAADAVGIVAALPRSQAELYSGDPGVTATLHHAHILVRSGRIKNAIALLRTAIAASHAADQIQQREGYGTLLLSIRLASTLFDAGDDAGALAMFDALAADKTIAPTYRLNIDVNRALVLARMGRSAQSLALVTAALKAFRGDTLPEEGEAIQIPDSEANFAWIEACALDGVGRHAEARARMAQIVPRVDESPVESTTRTARLAGFACMHDAAALADEFAAQLATAPVGSELFARLQPGDPERAADRATLARALAEPVLVTAMAGKARLLPAALQPAAAGWRLDAPLDAGTPHR